MTKILVPPWNYVLTAIAVLLVVVPKVIELRKSVRELRRGREELENEIKRLELIKLRYEIEVLRKEHDLAEIAGNAGVVTGSRAAAVPGALESVDPARNGALVHPPSPIHRWLTAHPMTGEFALWALQGLFGLGLIVCAIFIVLLPVAVAIYPERGLSSWTAIAGMLVYAALGLGLSEGYKRLRRLREAL